MTDQLSMFRDDPHPSPIRFGSDIFNEEFDFMNQTHQLDWANWNASTDANGQVAPMDAHQRPSKAEWEAQRATITDLYTVQKKTLKEVMQNMTSIGFHASENMYKKRIRLWKLDKKFKKHEVIAMLILKDYYNRLGKVPVFSIRGKDIDQQNLKRYAERAYITERDLLGLQPSEALRRAPCVSLRFLPSLPVHLKAPDHLDRYEAFSHTLVSYLHAAFDSGLCWKDEVGELRWKHRHTPINGFDALSQAFTGIRRIRRGNIQNGGTAIRSSFYRLESLIDNVDPRYWIMVLKLRNRFHRNGLVDYDQFLSNHVLALAKIHSQRTSHHKALITHIFQLRDAEIEHFSMRCYDIVLDVWTPYLSLSSLASAFRQCFDDHATYLLESRTNEVQAKCMEQLKKADSTEDEICHNARTICGMWWTLDKERKFDPEEMVQAIFDAALRLPRTEYRDDLHLLGMSLLARWNYDCKNYQVAKEWYEQYVTLLLEYRQCYNKPGLSQYGLQGIYEILDSISNHTEIADGDQQWRRKVEEIEKGWENELSEAVGDLSLE